jgi:nitrite reductase/ring-hydroxylating ferredoxin subunit
MAHERGLICRAQALVDGGKGTRFQMQWGTKTIACFAVRYRGTVQAYLNCCPHQGTELDWVEGQFFDDSGLYLLCATHGAVFVPHTGACCAGPCKGQSLIRVNVEEVDGGVYWLS